MQMPHLDTGQDEACNSIDGFSCQGFQIRVFANHKLVKVSRNSKGTYQVIVITARPILSSDS